MGGEDYGSMLQELLSDESDSMSEWEIDFIEALDRALGPRGLQGGITEKQAIKVSQIWHKVFR